MTIKLNSVKYLDQIIFFLYSKFLFFLLLPSIVKFSSCYHINVRRRMGFKHHLKQDIIYLEVKNHPDNFSLKGAGK